MLSGVAQAQEVEGSAPGRIGYVDFEFLLESSPQRKIRKEALQARFEGRYLEIDTNEKELEELEDRLVRDTAVMSEERRQALERQIRNLRRDVQRSKEDLAEDVSLAHDEQLKRLRDEIYVVVERYAKDEGYDLILASPAIYYSESIDLTQRLLERLEEASRIPSTAVN